MAEYWVMRVTTSKVCRVQESTASPIGERFKGPFPTRAAATAEMCRQLDDSQSDEDKCWAVVPQNVCVVAKPAKRGKKKPAAKRTKKKRGAKQRK